jgi:hypothetical protein
MTLVIVVTTAFLQCLVTIGLAAPGVLRGLGARGLAADALFVLPSVVAFIVIGRTLRASSSLRGRRFRRRVILGGSAVLCLMVLVVAIVVALNRWAT